MTTASDDETKKKTKKEKKKKKKHHKKEKKKETKEASDRTTPKDETDEHHKNDNPQLKQETTRKRKRKHHPSNSSSSSSSPSPPPLLPPHKYILAPMVGASDLPFRLLCRKYGTQLAYTPMMSSSQFATSSQYRTETFQTTPHDRPLVCHFAANDPTHFAHAAKLVEPVCDAIDLNLGCPQRVAYVGHFGSYLLDDEDRELVLDIVRAGSKAVSIPIFVKIRLLDTLDKTIALCRQLRDAGASLIAIHARYRATFHRNGPGARDGPALLEQVREVKKVVKDVAIIANGNVVTYRDVVDNLELTKADGIMSAEGILDHPALFLPRLGLDDEEAKRVLIECFGVETDGGPCRDNEEEEEEEEEEDDTKKKKKRKLMKKMREIERIEEKANRCGEDSLNLEQKQKLAMKSNVEKSLNDLKGREKGHCETMAQNDSSPPSKTITTTKSIPLSQLYSNSNDKLHLAKEYLALTRQYPVPLRTIIFHIRRMCRDMLSRYQLLENCISAKSSTDIETLLKKCQSYQHNPQQFLYDHQKALAEKEALEKKKREEGKRKAYEARMIRKAKREQKTDLEFYLRQGADVPTVEFIERLKTFQTKEEQLMEWKKHCHSQHCMAYHLDAEGCRRDRSCAFLHVDAKGVNAFDEREEVAG